MEHEASNASNTTATTFLDSDGGVELDLQALFQSEKSSEDRLDSSWDNLLKSMKSVNSNACNVSTSSFHMSISVLEASIATMNLSDATKSDENANGTPALDCSSSIFNDFPQPPTKISNDYPKHHPVRNLKRNDNSCMKLSAEEPQFDGKIGINLLQSAYAEQSMPRNKTNANRTKDFHFSSTSSTKLVGIEVEEKKCQVMPNSASQQTEEFGDPSCREDANFRKYSTKSTSTRPLESPFDMCHQLPSRYSPMKQQETCTLRGGVQKLAAQRSPCNIFYPATATGTSTQPGNAPPALRWPATNSTPMQNSNPTPSAGLSLLVAAVCDVSGNQSSTSDGAGSQHHNIVLHGAPVASASLPTSFGTLPPQSAPNCHIPSTTAPITPTDVIDEIKSPESSGLRLIPGTDFPVTTYCNGQIFPPLKPLSAYNYFFRDERDRILAAAANTPTETMTQETRQNKLLWDHWARDRTKKRAHRKSHGKISFQELSKLISSRWKALSRPQQDFFRQVATIDLERFKLEVKLNGGGPGKKGTGGKPRKAMCNKV